MSPTVYANSEDAYQLLHEGAMAFSRVEEWGMRINVEGLNRVLEESDDEIKRISSELKSSDVWRLWKRRYGDRSNLGSVPQLASVVTKDLGIEIKARTEKGKRVQMDEKVLNTIDHPFAKCLLRLRKLSKLRDNYLVGIKRELVGEYIHPSFNQHSVDTYRSSADHPNVQNQIRRDAEFAAKLRQLYIPTEGHVLVEADMRAHEFRCGACRWRDKRLIEYASDSTKDIHRDMGAECYMLDEVPKKVRDQAKNKFVFPTFYGSYYRNTSRNLWEAIQLEGLETKDGVPLREHLASKGIKRLGRCERGEKPVKGTFEWHIQQVDERFHSRFPEWDKRLQEAIQDYQCKGYFDMMTGFRCTGVYSVNQLANYGVQGPAYHCVLWDMIQMVKWIIKNRMKSRIICETHDSITGDVHRSELDDYVAKIIQVMTRDVREHFQWAIVPFDVEVDVCEDNWFHKRRVV
jgi:DNA polymerase-1